MLQAAHPLCQRPCGSCLARLLLHRAPLPLHLPAVAGTAEVLPRLLRLGHAPPHGHHRGRVQEGGLTFTSTNTANTASYKLLLEAASYPKCLFLVLLGCKSSSTCSFLHELTSVVFGVAHCCPVSECPFHVYTYCIYVDGIPYELLCLPGLGDQQLSSELLHGGRDGQPDVCGRPALHGPHHLHQHDLVGPPAGGAGPLLPLAGRINTEERCCALRPQRWTLYGPRVQLRQPDTLTEAFTLRGPGCLHRTFTDSQLGHLAPLSYITSTTRYPDHRSPKSRSSVLLSWSPKQSIRGVSTVARLATPRYGVRGFAPAATCLAPFWYLYR